MALVVETTIRDMYASTCNCLDGLNEKELEALCNCEDADIPVRVLRCATPGYYDVETPSGVKVAALSWVHLDGFTYTGPDL